MFGMQRRLYFGGFQVGMAKWLRVRVRARVRARIRVRDLCCISMMILYPLNALLLFFSLVLKNGMNIFASVVSYE